ncbi:hypothetical protein [Leifsonia sp. NPDC058248]|uniref:hypothetical protein n=1 Tax=Leifsonia sp. NPDC058248 TaxID=3346402 RepID=UPI0036D9CCE4
MTDARDDERYDRPPARSAEAQLSTEEVRVLWDFIHGDILSDPIRRRLREHWGMCVRHSWAYAVVEIELWEAGAGARGGHQPFDLSILYTDLLESMVDRLGTGRHGRMQMLDRHGECVICAEVRGGAPPGILVTHAGLDLRRLTAEANRMRFTERWMIETRPNWAAGVCPECATAAGVTPVAGTLPCRMHLRSSGVFSDASWELTRTSLAELAVQVRALTDSMTQSGRPATEAVDASWVKAVSWFDGWDFPLALATRGDADRA